MYLQTTPERPIMASVDIRAEDSILSTVTGDDPLFRLEGQDEIEALRDRIRWEARKVAYHRIKTYRRDEIVQAGGLPRIYDRDDWTRAFRPTDDAPMLTDLKFRHQTDAATPAWKLERDDLSLLPKSTPATDRARPRQDPRPAAGRGTVTRSPAHVRRRPIPAASRPAGARNRPGRSPPGRSSPLAVREHGRPEKGRRLPERADAAPIGMR